MNCMFPTKDLTESRKVQCRKVQHHHYLVELFQQGVEMGPRCLSTMQAACSSAQTVSMPLAQRVRTLSTEPYSSTAVVSTLERAFRLDTCRGCVNEGHQDRNKTYWKSTCTEQLEPRDANTTLCAHMRASALVECSGLQMKANTRHTTGRHELPARL